MQLISTNKKNTKNLSCSKARVDNEEQNKAKSEKVVETTKRNSSDQETNWRIYLSTLQKQYEIWQQHQVSWAYSHSTCEEVEVCFVAVNCFICFRVEIFYVVSIDNLLIAHVIETHIFFDARIRNCTRAFKEYIIYLVDCNIKKVDILSRNCFTTRHCIEALSSLDCDIQIDVQIVEKCKHCLLVYFVSNFYIIEILSYRERFVSHVCWKVEFIWFATTSNALVFFSRLWQMQSRKQIWSHTKSHYVILSCDDYIRFQIDQIRNVWINTCSRKRFASVFDLAMILDLIYFVFLSIFKNLSLVFCLQTLSRAFCHLSIYRLNRVKCLKSWKQWDIHEETLLKFRFSSLYFEKVLISSWKNHYFEEVKACCLFVVLLVRFFY